MARLKFGWGEVSLIPEGKKINLAGQFYERITDEYCAEMKLGPEAGARIAKDTAFATKVLADTTLAVDEAEGIGLLCVVLMRTRQL